MTTVDPFKLPKRMTRSQLEYWLLFSVCVANKSAKQTEIKVKALLADMPIPRYSGNQKAPQGLSPFGCISYLQSENKLLTKLKQHKLGQYKRIERAFREIIKLDLNNLSVEMLEKVHGIGPKTARMVMLYYDPTCEAVPLDTHVLKYLKAKGYDVPKSTPPAGKKYNLIERWFQELAYAQNKTVRELDTEVWQFYAKK